MLCTWEDNGCVYTSRIFTRDLSSRIYYREPPRYIGSYDNVHFKTLPKKIRKPRFLKNSPHKKTLSRGNFPIFGLLLLFSPKFPRYINTTGILPWELYGGIL